MSITVEFKDFEEMKDFARNLLGAGVTPPAQAVQTTFTQASVTPVAPVQLPVVPTQQHQAPVQQTQAPVPPQTPPVQTTVPTTAASYTLDDLARAAMTLMDSGRQGELLGLLGTFGVEALPALPPAQFGAFATALRGLGAQI